MSNKNNQFNKHHVQETKQDNSNMSAQVIARIKKKRMVSSADVDKLLGEEKSK